jgi:hypothetical protein
MSGRSSRQLASFGAFAVVGLWLVGFFLAGKSPKFAGSPASVVHYYATHHKQVLIAAAALVFLLEVGILLWDAKEPAVQTTT